MGINLKTKIGNVEFKNPIWVASGTFGSGEEFKEFFDINKIGAVVTKTVTLNKREGNLPPRVVETAAGLVNSIGLENKGVDFFKRTAYPFLKTLKTKVVISISGGTKDEFIECIKRLDEKDNDFPHAFELNLSCPNVTHTGTRYKLMAQDAEVVGEIVSLVKNETSKCVIAKLTPNVTDITEIAKAAEKAGADAVSLVNTYSAMAVDAEMMTPLLGNVYGGLSGPAIKPLALKAVWDVYNKVKIPIIGIGGIMTGLCAAEFMLCGASCVQVGTANLVDPDAPLRVLEEFEKYLSRKKIRNAGDLVGRLRTDRA